MSDLLAKNVRFAAVDFETTGRDPLHARATEVGIILFENGVEIERWGSLINPQEDIPEEVTELTGIRNEDVKDKPVFGELADEIIERLSDEYFLAYNASYDRTVLRAELGRVGKEVELKGIIDPLPYCWRYLRQARKITNARLGTVAEYLGVELENAHRATDDAAATAEIFFRLFEEVPEIPAELEAYLGVQAALEMEMEETFRGPRRRPSVSMSDVNVELGPAYIQGQMSDPLRFLFRRLPDVRDVR